MCIYKKCPIFEKCDKELEQVIYCRHVEMIKKIGLMRLELKKKNALAPVTEASQKAQIQVACKSVSEPSEALLQSHHLQSTVIN